MLYIVYNLYQIQSILICNRSYEAIWTICFSSYN